MRKQYDTTSMEADENETLTDAKTTTSDGTGEAKIEKMTSLIDLHYPEEMYGMVEGTHVTRKLALRVVPDATKTRKTEKSVGCRNKSEKWKRKRRKPSLTKPQTFQKTRQWSRGN